MPDQLYLLVVRFPTGGIRTHLKYLKALVPGRSDRLRPVLICPDGQEAAALAQILDVPPELNLSKDVRSLRDMCRAVLKASRRFDARLIHSQGFTSAAAAAPTAILHRRAHVVTAHDVVTEAAYDRASMLQRLGLGLALRSADVVHAVGSDCAASIRRLPFMRNAHNLVVIQNGINPDQFRNVAPRDIRAELGLGSNIFLVGFFGRFMAPKGFRTLVDAVALLRSSMNPPPIMVLAVGGGGFVREDKAYVERLGLAPQFRFMDAVENPAPLIAAVDCVAMPSRSEAFGLLAAEVMALGVPLLASTCVGLREITRNTPTRTFPPDNPGRLADAITAEIGDRSKSRAQAFAREALGRFDFTPNAERIWGLLESLYE